MKGKPIAILAALIIAAAGTANLSAQKPNDSELLRVRETVWRSYFAGDTRLLAELVPPGTIVITPSEKKWMSQSEVLQDAADFHAKGGKLISLEFPRTEVQHFGDVAIVWSEFVLETEMNGKRSTGSGRATEIFVRQRGRWTNPGWHTDNVHLDSK